MTLDTTYRQFGRLAVEEPRRPPEPIPIMVRKRLSGDDLAMRQEAETHYVSSLVVLGERQRQCMQAVADQMRLMPTAVPGAQESLYVVGPPGTGKSTAVMQGAFVEYRKALRYYGQQGSDDPRIAGTGYRHALIPVIWINVRAEAGAKSVNGQILDFLHESGVSTHRMSASAMADRILKISGRHGVRLIVLDDTHNLGTRGKVATGILQAVKNLQTDLGSQRISFVYIGNPEPHSGELNLASHLQLSQRLIPFRMDPYEFDVYNDVEANLIWADHLEAWEQALMPVLPGLGAGDLASALGRRLWNMTHGSPGALAGLLKRHTVSVLRNRDSRALTITKAGLDRETMPIRYARPAIAGK